jgi:hypothetical protein
MNNMHNENHKTPSQNLQVWYCEHCQNIHFKTQNVMLDFSKKEFVELTNAILDIFQNHFDPLEISRIAGMALPADEVLMSETIS